MNLSQRRSLSAPAVRRLIWPLPSIFARLAQYLGNSRGLRNIFRALLPINQLVSDATDITYVSWLVPAERVRQLLPPPLELQLFTVGKDNQAYTLISILSFKNGHFGPCALGPLRKYLCASPPQVNCRLYVKPVGTDAPPNDTVFYLSVNLDNPWMTVFSRLFADGLPAHYAITLRHRKTDIMPDEAVSRWKYTTCVSGGTGSALDLYLEMTAPYHKKLADIFGYCFGDYDAVAGFIIERNRAVCVKSLYEVDSSHLAGGAISATLVESLIVPPTPGERARHLIPAKFHADTFFASDWLQEIIKGCECVSFVIPRIRIDVKEEKTSVMSVSTRLR